MKGKGFNNLLYIGIFKKSALKKVLPDLSNIQHSSTRGLL